ncbi:class I SAM-dependent methyltransferase [Treponema zioleckii]|uniref:class I SAM-dependent methyltransferase n=1 Tax=Treponema zioleckii TaxID=331680 RepID=UPI00168BDA93|nr:SAM-dependent methyltransferase [Treponema zioleckii]
MILSATFSKPVKNISELLGEEYTRIKIKLSSSSVSAKNNDVYFAEFFTEKQVFHKRFSETSLNDFLNENAGKTFKACVVRTESEEIQILSNKKGKISRIVKKIRASEKGENPENFKDDSNTVSAVRTDLKKRFLQYENNSSDTKKKNYILAEGKPVPFLVHLGIMTAEGKVISSKYDKFRQINRFLEFIDDIIDDVSEKCGSKLRILDFGSGKSYLTFAVQYFLTEIKKIDAEIFGLDLKKDVIEYCNSLTQKLNIKNLTFAVGDIASFGEEKSPDIIITLHACDTATDFALDYAIRRNAKAILSVPCCQHEINSQLKKTSVPEDSPFAPLLKYGLIKERFSALVTDALRAEFLEAHGYKTQILEFIEESNTPKNLLIRAVKKSDEKSCSPSSNPLLAELNVSQTLFNGLSSQL